MPIMDAAAASERRQVERELSTMFVNYARVFHTVRYAVKGRGRRGRSGEQAPMQQMRGPGVVIALCCVGFLALLATQWQGRQPVGGIVVRGATGLSETAIRAVADTFVDRRMRDVVFADVRDLVERLPYVQEASVYMSGTNRLTIDVRERAPVAHVLMSDGSLRYVDVDGRVLPPPPQLVGLNVPLVRSDGNDACTERQLRTAAAMLTAARQHLDEDLMQSVSEVVVDAACDRIDLLAGGVTWKLSGGRTDGFRRTFADMNVFWEQASMLLPTSGAIVDMSWQRQIVVRKRPEVATINS
ncbi:MAG: FtsQ-type POTRA domain-containing protein [Candidatus Kapabacteria bacterium]|nr:FtsQ-type POTRA domain-containing protein [Candidatus Kapabacteria bacterium]